MYLARPVQIGQHSPARNTTSRPQAPPAPPVAPPPPPGTPQNLKAKSKSAPRKTELKSVFDRDKLLDEVRTGVKLRHTVTNDKSAPIGVGRVRSGGYSPPPDSTASTSVCSSRPEARKPVSYGQHIDEPPPAPAPPKAPPPPALLKHSTNTKFDRDQLLSEIHGGVKLRKTVTNDRSAPIGVGTVRKDLDLSQPPIPETSTLHLSAAPPPPPPPNMLPPPPPSPHHLSPQPQHKPAKPITNPALLKLGGKQPVNRDALLASIRGGVKLRKVGISDHSRETSPDQHASPAPPPPPPLFAPPPPPPPLSEPVRRSRSPNPLLMKLGGKVTVDRDELMRSIRQGVKLRKTVTNDKSSAIINDADSGVKSPGRSSPSTSNYEDDVYGSQSLSDLSSIGTSRFSSLSNIPPERPNDLPFVSPALVVPETGTAATSAFSDSRSPTKSPPNRPEMISVPIGVLENSDEEVEEEPETVTLQLPAKRKVDESYSSPIPTREQIEAEIPTGSARDRIRLFGGTARDASHSPERSLSRPTKSEMEMNNSEFGIARMRELFKDTTAEKQPAPVPGRRAEERGRVAAVGIGENSIKKMVRKFSTDDGSNKTSQPIWCQKKEEKAAEPEKKSVTVRRKTSGTKGSIRRKSSTKESKVRRKSSVKNESPPTAATTVPTKNYAAPSKSKGLAPEPPPEVEDEAKEKRGGSRWTPPKVDISKFRERFENHSQTEQTSIRRGSTTEETAKPGRIKKPPWIRNEESESSPLALKTEEAFQPMLKKTRAPELPTESEKTNKLPKKTTSTRSALKQQKSQDHEEFSEPVQPPVPQSDTAGVVKRVTSDFKDSEKAPPVPSSSPPKIPEKQVIHVPVIAEETSVPTREGVGPYRYVRKDSTTDKKTAIRKDSASSKRNSALGGGNLLNSVPKPFGTHLSTTGQTTIIDADVEKEEPKGAPANRHFAFKPKIQSKGAVREREEAFADRTTTRTAKKTSEITDGVHYANIGVAVTKVYAVPINAPWYHPDKNLSSSSSSSLSSSSASCYNSHGSLRKTGTYCLSPVTGREYPDNLWNNHYHYLQQQQQKQQLHLPPPQKWDGVVGRAHRVIVGEQRSQITLNGFQRSFDGNDPHESQQEQLERQQEHHFRQNYRFQIDLENDQQPLRIVHR